MNPIESQNRKTSTTKTEDEEDRDIENWMDREDTAGKHDEIVIHFVVCNAIQLGTVQIVISLEDGGSNNRSTRRLVVSYVLVVFRYGFPRYAACSSITSMYTISNSGRRCSSYCRGKCFPVG